VADRNIVADTFFAVTEPGVTPKLATQDKRIYNALAMRAGMDPAKARRDRTRGEARRLRCHDPWTDDHRRAAPEEEVMGYRFDLFVAELRCPRCGHVSAADDTTDMQTKIRDERELAWLGVGSALEINPATVPGRCYYLVQPPGDTIRILQSWSCPSCEFYPNWAEIVVRDGRIESITAVPLDRETLGRAHFIDEDVDGVAAMLAGRDTLDVARNEDVVSLLRQLL
jgi:hypothetical protein